MKKQCTLSTGTEVSESLESTLSEYWNGRAADYHAYHDSSLRARVEYSVWSAVMAAALDGIEAGSTVLDMGCGTGFISHIVADLGFRVVGVDSSPGMLEQARRDSAKRASLGLSTAKFLCADVTSPSVLASALSGVADSGAAAVLSRWVLWTLADPGAALNLWARFVRPTGRVIAADGLWYPEGINSTMEVESAQGKDAFIKTYDEGVLRRLPLSSGVGLDDYRRCAEAAGLKDISMKLIPETRELDRRFGTSKGHESATQFIMSAAPNF